MTFLPSRTHLLGASLLSVVATGAAAQGVMLTQGQVYARSGNTTTNLPAGVTFGTASGTGVFDIPVMAPSGAVLVRTKLVGTGVTTLNDRALVLGYTNGDARVILRAQDLDPSGTFPNSQVLQTSGSTGLPLGSNTFGSQRITCSLLAPFPEVVFFQAQLYDPTGLDGLTTTGTAANNQILYYGAPSSLQILARRAVTAMPDGAVLLPDAFGHQSTGLGTNGTVVFKTTLSTTLGAPSPAVTTANDTAWITGTPGSLNYVIRESDIVAVPGGTVGIATLGGDCVINDVGQFLHADTLSTTLGSTPATTANDRAIFITTGGVHSLLMREGDPAPDANGVAIPGVTYSAVSNFTGPSLAQGFPASGRAAFHSFLGGSVTTADDNAVFIGSPGLVQMVVREGDPAPGTGGETIATINTTMGFSDYGVVVGVSLVQPGVGGVTALNNTALYLCRPNVAPELIAREGSPCPGVAGYVFGDLTGSTDFGSSSQGRLNDRGVIMFTSMKINDGVNVKASTWSWDPLHGLQAQLLQGDTIGGQLVDFLAGSVLQFPSGDGGSLLGLTLDGDFVINPQTVTANFIARGHVGGMVCTPSAVPVSGNVPQYFNIDVGPTYGNMFYLVLATSGGTRTGFQLPLGPQVIPLDYDSVWTTLSIEAANSAIWVNNVGLTDPNGKNYLPAGFVMPPGFPGYLGTVVHHAALLVDFNLVSQYVTEPSGLLLY